jgi:leucyl aminopeptidase
MKLFAGKAKDRPDALFLFFVQGEKGLSKTAQEIDKLSKGGVKRLFELGFKASRKDAEILVLASGRWPLAVLLGLGERKDLDGERFREAAAAGLRRLSRYHVKRIEIELIDLKNSLLSLEEQARAVGEACFFAGYRYSEFKKREDKSPSEIWIEGGKTLAPAILKKARTVGEEHCFVRDLASKPGSELWPEKFAEIAADSAAQFGLEIKIYDDQALEAMGYNGILRVGQGSKRKARLAELRYNGGGAAKPLIGLVGKGVTFDTGGISLKTPQGMEQMKGDMTGAAVVLGVMRAASRLGLKQNLVAVLPLVENMPGGNAQRPGDILRMADGTTVEVISTDAEGRLILADGLYHCRTFKPSKIVDIATLTGACTIALGRHAIALMGTDEELMSKLSQAGIAAGERCWVMPLWDDYKEMIRGEVSDLRNVGKGREAGTIIGGMFLKHFVKDTPWAHLDIASTDWSEDNHPYLGRGPTGKGLRLLVRFLESME